MLLIQCRIPICLYW